MLFDILRSYILQTNQQDYLAFDTEMEDIVAYEKDKIEFLLKWCGFALDNVSADDEADEDVKLVVAKVLMVGELVSTINDDLHSEQNSIITGEDMWDEQAILVQHCEDAVLSISSVNKISKMKSRVIDLCDAGPGVGITNENVSYRVCSEFLICHYDYYHRIHLDSSKNEVERIQSSVGDAVCDGGYLDFNYFPQFDDLSEEEINGMSAKDIERYELMRIEKNARKVCEEVSSRIDGAPTIDGFMKSFVTKPASDLFFLGHSLS